ncbi:MEDS domain-containing protein [Nonomuraea sp. NBC_01738]|uniref:MEDS domain-containing protein n=1 Tax=Nonomuraea sp. NBC_01738 TaxID=2976003 RepID=UPI002E0D9E3A|nr:MEDS domain-containing protein [Nonomuraea sp. NBC_01738]
MHPARALPHSESLKHIAVPYGSDAAFLRVTLPRIRDGLEQGRQVLVSTCETKLGLLAEALGDDAGRIDLRLATSWYAHPPRTLAACHDYTRHRRTLIIGEPVWTGRSEREVREWIRYESVINAALGG